MIYKEIADTIIKLKAADLLLRDKLIQNGQLEDGYNKEMKQLHNNNANILDGIIEIIGYPTIDKVGAEASEAAWLVIQHSISRPPFMKKCVNLLENAVSEGKANPKDLAYLSDRIAVFEGRPQLYGTQFDWDEGGALSPQPYDDLEKVNRRRKTIELKSLEEQVEIMKARAQKENQSLPPDMDRRKTEYNEWRKSVGWIQ